MRGGDNYADTGGCCLCFQWGIVPIEKQIYTDKSTSDKSTSDKFCNVWRRWNCQKRENLSDPYK